MVEERRRKERYRVWFPITVVTEDGQEGTAITFDVSSTGLLMAAPGALPVGAQVVLRFRIKDENDDEQEVRGRVVRAEPHDEDPWRHRMAIEFETPQPDLESRLAAEAEP